ncbi:MAG TPA: type II toxin-antitoxin system RelE/ParE family toxin [Pyrinomonadaceae bacterium]|nr:type II toxin-antitoxin system RelE/ParE family toxin [Pyrinomonadaceae bacterium]
MKIVWTEPAVEDLRELYAYIARDSDVYASGFVQQLILAAEGVAKYPNAGRVAPEKNDENVREVLYQHYRLIYRIGDNRLEVLAVIHGARDLAKFQETREGLS